MTDAERLEEILKKARAGGQLLTQEQDALLAEVERLRAIIAWAGNEEAVRIAGLPNPSPEEPSHAH